MLELLQPSIPQSNSSAPKDPECKVRTQWPMWNMNTLEYRSSAWQPNLESKTGTSLRASCFSHTGAQLMLCHDNCSHLVLIKQKFTYYQYSHRISTIFGFIKISGKLECWSKRTFHVCSYVVRFASIQIGCELSRLGGQSRVTSLGGSKDLG